MALFNFRKTTQPIPCCSDNDGCCTPEQASSGSCCCEDDCCTSGQEAAETCCCCEDSDCCTPEEAETDSCCCCGEHCCETETLAVHSVKVLGGGCKNCHRLMDNTQEALQSLGMDVTVELVSDMANIAAYGVMSTPALVVDDKVVSFGKVLKTEEIVNILKKVWPQ